MLNAARKHKNRVALLNFLIDCLRNEPVPFLVGNQLVEQIAPVPLASVRCSEICIDLLDVQLDRGGELLPVNHRPDDEAHARTHPVRPLVGCREAESVIRRAGVDHALPGRGSDEVALVCDQTATLRPPLCAFVAVAATERLNCCDCNLSDPAFLAPDHSHIALRNQVFNPLYPLLQDVLRMHEHERSRLSRRCECACNFSLPRSRRSDDQTLLLLE